MCSISLVHYNNTVIIAPETEKNEQVSLRKKLRVSIIVPNTTIRSLFLQLTRVSCPDLSWTCQSHDMWIDPIKLFVMLFLTPSTQDAPLFIGIPLLFNWSLFHRSFMLIVAWFFFLHFSNHKTGTNTLVYLVNTLIP